MRIVLNHVEQDQGRTVGPAVTTLPVTQCCGGKSKLSCKLRLRHSDFGTQGPHIHGTGAMNADARLVPFGVGNGFLQALLDAVECLAHVFLAFAFQMLTSP